MSIVGDVLHANERYAEGFSHGSMPVRPAKALAVVTCKDARLMPEQFLGLGAGDAHVFRNAGGIVTDDALRSLIISHKLLGTTTFFVINHTDCGLLTLDEGALRKQLAEETGVDASGIEFHGFKDLEANVRSQVAKITSHPFLASIDGVYGFVYDVKTGRLRQVA